MKTLQKEVNNMILDDGKYFLYRHIRLDTNEVFYVGLGTKRLKHLGQLTDYWRAREYQTRSKLWKNVVGKTPYKIEIILETNDVEFIRAKEIEFIELYGRRDLGTGPLVNLHKGGTGAFPNPAKPEDIERRRLKNLGRKVSEETKRKLSEASKGRKHTEEFKKQVSLRFKGKQHSEEHMQKLWNGRRGIKRTQEDIDKQRNTTLPVERRLEAKKLLEEGYSKFAVTTKLKMSHEALCRIIEEYNIPYKSKKGLCFGKKLMPNKI